jgi:hypothetical protein
MGDGADEVAVLEDGRAGHARVNIGPTSFFILLIFNTFPKTQRNRTELVRFLCKIGH